MNAIKSSIFFCITLLCVGSFMAITHACTISFQHISTRGTATDITDDDFSTDSPTTQKMRVPNLKLTGPTGLN